jgi:nucleoside phosphorylase
MLLLTIAHHGEAQEFIKRKYKQTVDFHFNGLYRSEDGMLLVSGEGLQMTSLRLTAVYTYFSHQIDYVINMGIAGSLSSELQLNQIYGIRTVHHEMKGNDGFPSFNCKETLSKMDCVSAHQSVLTDQHARDLSPLADIVDRELWAVGSVCQLFSLPFKSYKLISDKAGGQTNGKEIISKAPKFSKHLFDFYKNLSLAKETWEDE